MADVGGTSPDAPTILPPSGTEGQGPTITPDPGTSLPPPNTNEPPPDTQPPPSLPPSTTTPPPDPPSTVPPPIIPSTTSEPLPLPPLSQPTQPIISTTPSPSPTFEYTSTPLSPSSPPPPPPPSPPSTTTQAPTITISDAGVDISTDTTSFTTIVTTLEDGSLSTTVSALPTQLATSTPSNYSSRKNGLIAGTTAAGIIALLIILGVVFFWRRHKLKKRLSIDALLKKRNKGRGLLEDEDWDDDGRTTQYRDFAPGGRNHLHDRSVTSSSQVSAYNYTGHIGGLGLATGYGYTPLPDPLLHRPSLSSIEPPIPQFMRDQFENNIGVGVGVGQGGSNSGINSAQGSRPSTPSSPAWKPSESGSIFREEGVWPLPSTSSVSVVTIGTNAATSPGIGVGRAAKASGAVIDNYLAPTTQSPSLPFTPKPSMPTISPTSSPPLVTVSQQPQQPNQKPGIASVYPSIARLIAPPAPPPLTYTQTQTKPGHLHQNLLVPKGSRLSLPQISPLSSISSFSMEMNSPSSYSHSPLTSTPGAKIGRGLTTDSGHSQISYSSFVSGKSIGESAMAREWMFDVEGKSREGVEHMHMAEVSSSHQVNVTYQSQRHNSYVVESARTLSPSPSLMSPPSPTLSQPLLPPPPTTTILSPPPMSGSLIQQKPPPTQGRNMMGGLGFQLPLGAAAPDI